MHCNCSQRDGFYNWRCIILVMLLHLASLIPTTLQRLHLRKCWQPTTMLSKMSCALNSKKVARLSRLSFERSLHDSQQAQRKVNADVLAKFDQISVALKASAVAPSSSGSNSQSHNSLSRPRAASSGPTVAGNGIKMFDRDPSALHFSSPIAASLITSYQLNSDLPFPPSSIAPL